MISKLFSVIVVISAYSVSSLDLQQKPFLPIEQNSLRLLSDAPGHAEWADPDEWSLQGKKFFDITDHEDLDAGAGFVQQESKKYPLPQNLTQQRTIKAVFDKTPFDLKRMKDRLTHLTSFQNRHYKSQSGLESSKWVEQQLLQVIDQTGANVKIQRFRHSFPQFSLVARMEPTINKTSNSEQPFIILSAHYDTVKGWFGEHMPGADDDGSGSITNMEIFTILCEAQSKGLFNLKYPIEFHWYAAEEVGLRGSQDVAAQYKKLNKKVMAVLHFDMTGYRGKSDSMGVITDYVDEDLTKFLKSIISQYTNRNILESKCNYACSDHASYTKAGFRSAFPFEGTFKEQSPYIHSSRDTVDHIDFEHMSSFVQTGVAFALELVL